MGENIADATIVSFVNWYDLFPAFGEMLKTFQQWTEYDYIKFNKVVVFCDCFKIANYRGLYHHFAWNATEAGFVNPMALTAMVDWMQFGLQ
jgi:hypothetical protein